MPPQLPAASDGNCRPYGTVESEEAPVHRRRTPRHPAYRRNGRWGSLSCMTTLTPDADKVIPTGRIERVDGDYVLAFDLQLDYPRSYIWSLLTEREKVAKWLGTLLDDWAVGHAYELDMDGGSASGTVLQFNPPLSLQITWEDELGGESVIEWRVLES